MGKNKTLKGNKNNTKDANIDARYSVDKVEGVKENDNEVAVDIYAFLAEALSINTKIHPLMDKIYFRNEIGFTQSSKQHKYYNHVIATEGNIQQEYYFKMALGLFSYDGEGEMTEEELLYIMKKGWSYIDSYVRSHNKLVMDDFMMKMIRKYNALNTFTDDELNSYVTIALVFCTLLHKEIDTEDRGYKTAIAYYVNRLKNYGYKKKFFDLNNITKEEDLLLKQAENDINSVKELRTLKKFGYVRKLDIQEDEQLMQEYEKYYIALEKVFEYYGLSLTSLRSPKGLSDKDLKTLIFIYTYTHNSETYDKDNFLKYIYSATLIANTCVAYKESKEFFFANSNDTLYKEIANKDTEIKQLKKDKLILQDNNERLKAEIDKLQMENKRLNQELKEKDNYKNEVTSLRSFVFSMDNQNDKDNKDKEFINNTETEIDYKLLENMKSVVIGGHPQWQAKIKKYLKNSTFISTDNMNFDIDILKNCDAVFIYTNYLNHGLYYKVMDVVREYDIKLAYLKANVNEKMVLIQMEESLDNINLS